MCAKTTKNVNFIFYFKSEIITSSKFLSDWPHITDWEVLIEQN